MLPQSNAGSSLAQPHANKGYLSKCVSSHKTRYHGGWEQYFIELFPHWNHHHLKDLFAKERIQSPAKYLAYFGPLRKQLDVGQQQCWGSVVLCLLSPGPGASPSQSLLLPHPTEQWVFQSQLLALSALSSSRRHWAGKGREVSMQFTVLILHP